MKRFRGLIVSLQMGLHPSECEPVGPCQCGRCDLWIIKFRGRSVLVPERIYDHARYAKALSI